MSPVSNPAEFRHDPSAHLDYRVDWSQWLAEGEEITISTWFATGLTVDSDDSDESTATVWLSGGEAGTTYQVTNRIVTDQGRTDDRTFRLRVVNR